MKKILLIVILLMSFTYLSLAQDAIKSEINTFSAKTGAKSTIDKATSNLSFLQFPIERPFSIEGETPAAKAMSFLNQNKGLFALVKGNDSYQVNKSIKDNYGMDHVFLQQYYKGVPIFDGVLKFHFNKNVQITSLNGNSILVDKLNPIPTISQEEAEQLAIKYVNSIKFEPISAPLIAKKSSLYVFQKGLVQGYKGAVHLVYEIEVSNDSDIREFLYIDAHSKELIEQFSGIHTDGLDRRLYETNYVPTSPTTNLKWKEGETFPDPDGAGSRPPLDVWQQSEVVTASHIYNMMKNAFGHASYNDGATLATEFPMITVNNALGINCPNANWNGVSANYCTGLASDDIVAHEWGHAYTEYTNNLIYAWQSGALNESYSDVWGETVDQINGYFDGGTETTGLRTTACGSSSRWLLGEQSTSFGGAIRDMWNPTCYADPGKMSDTQYTCDPNNLDVGGVHTNSGIPNHAYALLVDGGTYNGQTIIGLGLTKAAHIWWYAQKNFINRTTDFSQFADNLEASLTALVGVNLYALSTATGVPTLSGIKITIADLIQLQKVLLAVEMRAENNCGFVALLTPVPAICTGGLAGNAIYFEDFEDGIVGWSTSNQAGATSDWTPHDWVANDNPPDNRPGTVAFAANTNAGDCVTNSQNGKLYFTSPIITIPTNTLEPYSMAFDHYVAMEKGYDGGIVEYSINGAGFQLVPLSAFSANGYKATLANGAAGNTNPLAGLTAFTGADGGSVTGSWGQSRVNLTALGLLESSIDQTIQFRWVLGQDGCNGWDGWYIDDVRVYSCTIPTTAVKFYTKNTSINEAEAVTSNTTPSQCLPYIEKSITIKINKAPSLPVTVTLNPITVTGGAKEGITADFTVSPNSVILKSGSTRQDFKVRIYNDSNIETNETFTLSYTLSGGGDAFPETNNQTHTITIIDDDFEPGILVNQLLNENFESGLFPVGWKGYKSDGTTPDPTENVYPDSWAVKNITGLLDPTGNNFLIADSDEFGNGSWDKIIETKAFNTLGASTIDLSFLEYFKIWMGTSDFNEIGTVEAWDGTVWRNILTHNEAGGNIGSLATPFNRAISIPIAYSNAAMKIRFRYTANFDYGWSIDNIKVSAGYPTQVQTTVNTANPAEEYLGPMETAVFYDPISGNVIAKIKNLTTHDYGCTKLEVDRAGNGQIPWFGPYKISAKTFKVTPTTNNPSGQYDITFYYKNTEIAGSTINSMGKTSVNTTGNSIAYASLKTGNVFNSDFSYTATFNTGFSSFGLTDAMPSTNPLPVKLVEFNGKYTPEGNQLKWITASETNNDRFIIERSQNARDFYQIGTVKGAENSTITNNYLFYDAQHMKGINYYRLKQLDLDGKFGFSNTIAIESPVSKGVDFYPNPVQANLKITIPNQIADQILVRIINMAGQEMVNETANLKDSIVNQDMSKLPAGAYIIIISDKNSTYNFSIIKQ